MRRVLNYITVLSFAFCSATLQGQPKYGQIIGINLSSMSYTTGEKSYVPCISPGIHFGGFLELQLKKHLSFKPALIFTAKGSSYKTDSSQFSISPIYAEIPVNILVSFGSGDIKLTFYAGPYIACGIGGNSLPSGGTFQNLNFGSGAQDDIRRFDLGFNAGAGLNIRGFLVSAQYGESLINLSPPAKRDTELKNRVTGISVTMPLAGRQ